MHSLYGYMNQHGNRNFTMGQLHTDRGFGLPGWRRPVSDWLAGPVQANRLHLHMSGDMENNVEPVQRNAACNTGRKIPAGHVKCSGRLRLRG